MNSHQVINHLRALNPVTDEHTLDSPQMSSTAFLRSLDERRPTMSVLKQSGSTANRFFRVRPALAFAIGLALVVALGAIGAVLISDDGSDVAAPTSGLEAAEQYVALRTAGDTVATLELMTPAAVEEERNFMHALEAMNIRGTQVMPCRENRSGDYECELAEENDFLQVVGLSPWNATFTLEVTDDYLIDEVDTDTDIFLSINDFWIRFRNWMDETHPEDSARMEGSLPQGSLDGDDARIALEYIDDFVAQSDVYPLDPASVPRR